MNHERSGEPVARTPSVAYFSMEIGLESAIPTYAGGLGVLAGDTVRSAADLGLAMVAVSLLPRQGYFHQRLDATGWQTEEPVHWAVDDYLEEIPQRAGVRIEGREVTIRAWRYEVRGTGGHTVPVYLLDTDVEGNSEADRSLTHHLYGGDDVYRLSQETILGIGGLRLLRRLGHTHIRRYHLNEGHASLLILELLNEALSRQGTAEVTEVQLEAVREQCIFTTHTPVPAGHDKFPLSLATHIIELGGLLERCREPFCYKGELNMTYLALANSRYVNGVAKKHGEISRQMFSGYRIESITNGIHVGTWTSEPFGRLFDHYVPDWRNDSASLRYAISIPREEIWAAHEECKRQLVQYVNRLSNAGLDRDMFTLGFARRATRYKRADMLLADPERLRSIARRIGPIQVVYAGKAHPHDQAGKEIIQHIHRVAAEMGQEVRIAYLREYDMSLARLLVTGSDVWLNTPQPPMEASGTSGMKAAVNGVPSLSILDGWWIEGCIEDVTGWAIESAASDTASAAEQSRMAAENLYDKLEDVVLPAFYERRDHFVEVMRNAIAINGSFFNTERMLSQYISRAYF